MSTSFLEENNNMIYYQHHDHSYAKNIMIDHAKNIILDSVNDDCLAEIFTYVPVCERPKIALVCQRWKRVLDYTWSNVKKLKLTHWEQAEYQNCLKKYPTADGKLSFLKSLLNKCGRYLTQLDSTAYGHSDIVPVINEHCPNLVKLRLRFTHDDDFICWTSFLRLTKLKVLAIILQHKNDRVSVNLIVSLLAVADTLTDLILSNWENDINKPCDFPINTIVVVLHRLKALKRLEVGGVQLFPELEEYLRDNSTLEFYYYDHYINKDSIKPNQLMSITVLNLIKCKISDDCLYAITNTIKNLTRLCIHCEWISNDGVVTISKMSNLHNLFFVGINNSIDSSSIKLLKNLIQLKLPGSNKITDDLAIKVVENSPKMRVLFVLNSSITVEFIKKVAEISTNRKLATILGVTFIADSKQYESPFFKIHIVQKNKKKKN